MGGGGRFDISPSTGLALFNEGHWNVSGWGGKEGGESRENYAKTTKNLNVTEISGGTNLKSKSTVLRRGEAQNVNGGYGDKLIVLFLVWGAWLVSSTKKHLVWELKLFGSKKSRRRGENK